MSESYLNSQQLIHLIKQGSSDYLSGDYRFDTLQSGISLHGGRAVAQKDFQSSRLTQPYISFVLLLEGSIDFAVNQHRHRIQAGEGRIILVAAEREILFSRYLHQGETTAKITIKGLEQWLRQPAWQHLLPAVYSQTVRHWQLDTQLKQLALETLANPGQQNLAATLKHEALVLNLLSHLWQDFTEHFPFQTASASTMPSENHDDFVQQLNQAFEQGSHQVTSLAQTLCISERTLQRRLKESFGITASDWLRHKHMQYALYALSTRQASIGEIAYRCGYKHVSSFTQAFRQYFGHTPAEIRKQDEWE